MSSRCRWVRSRRGPFSGALGRGGSQLPRRCWVAETRGCQRGIPTTAACPLVVPSVASYTSWPRVPTPRHHAGPSLGWLSSCLLSSQPARDSISRPCNLKAKPRRCSLSAGSPLSRAGSRPQDLELPSRTDGTKRHF